VRASFPATHAASHTATGGGPARALRPLLAFLLPVCSGLLLACAPTHVRRPGEPCPIDPGAHVTVEEGEVPLVIVSTHAGGVRPLGCDLGDGALRAIAPRGCTADLDESCRSGPCRAGGPDKNAHELTLALVEELGRCLGGRPSLVLAEVERNVVDMNRDARDPGDPRCAFDDGAVLPYWEAFHHAVEERIKDVVKRGGERALLIDLHTYNSLPAAPPPAIMLGAGEPFGSTLPHLAEDDPTLAIIFGQGGLRRRLMSALSSFADLTVAPPSVDAPLTGLFKGRYVVHRYARRLGTEVDAAGPAVDALQIEVSSKVRDAVAPAAAALATAVCGAFGERLALP
jgi:hypothetical protein